jgi:hypothetical protein
VIAGRLGLDVGLPELLYEKKGENTFTIQIIGVVVVLL